MTKRRGGKTTTPSVALERRIRADFGTAVEKTKAKVAPRKETGVKVMRRFTSVYRDLGEAVDAVIVVATRV